MGTKIVIFLLLTHGFEGEVFKRSKQVFQNYVGIHSDTR